MNISQEQYNKLPTEYKEYFEPFSNKHCTVKPISVMAWLVRLVTPPKGICLDPFAGSGTTGVACMALHRDFIGIELNPEYMAIAERRILNVNPLFRQELMSR